MVLRPTPKPHISIQIPARTSEATDQWRYSNGRKEGVKSKNERSRLHGTDTSASLLTNSQLQCSIHFTVQASTLNNSRVMTRIVARVCLALALVATASSSTAHAAAAGSPDTLQWEIDYKSWMEDIKASVAGNAELEQKAAELQTKLDAAIAAGVPEEDRMRLLYDFLGIADSNPTFVGFTTKEAAASSTTVTAPAATTAVPTTPTPTPSSAAASTASYKTLVSMTSLAVAVVGYALL